MTKRASLLLIVILTASSLVLVNLAGASVTNPSVPEFTLKSVDYSYDVPPTYGIDQFTGKTVIKVQGEHIDNRSVMFTIRNQPFTPYVDSSNNTIGLYYNFRYKGHFGNDWSYYPFSESGQGTRRYSAMFYVLIDQSPKLSASNSEYTDIVLGLPFLFGVDNPPVGSQVDFQVQALIGHIDYEGDGFYSYAGQRSDWSNTQTITVGQSDSTATPSTSPPQDSTTTPNQSTNETTDQSQGSMPQVNQPDAQANEPQLSFNWIEIIAFAIFGTVITLLIVIIALMHRRIQGLERKAGNSELK